MGVFKPVCDISADVEEPPRYREECVPPVGCLTEDRHHIISITEKKHTCIQMASDCARSTSPSRSSSWPSGIGRRRSKTSSQSPVQDPEVSSTSHTSKSKRVKHSAHSQELDTGQPEVQAEVNTQDDEHRYHCNCHKCLSTTWTRSKMLRFSGHCILFFIIASCGGLLVKRNYESQFEFPSQDLSDILESPELRGVRMQPVSIKEFKKLISRTNNYYDFLRIFLNKKNLTNESIDQIVNARTIEKILKGNEGRMLSKRDDEEEEDYDDEMAYSDDVQSRLDEELAEAFHHIDEFESSSLSECKYPQPEVVRVTDEEGRNRVFVPECTILHRCRNVSGCCGNKSRECGPKRIQIIERAFLAVDFVNNDGREVIPGKEMVIKKVFINHTECECRELRGLPSCDRYECPFPFSKKRPNIQCVCDCFESPHEENFRCQGIKEGRAPLDEEALMCIKSGTCLKPECTAGKFDVPSGYCPELPEDKLALQKYDTLATHTHDHPEEMTFNKHGKTAEMDYNKNGNPTKTTSIKDGNPPHKTTTNRGNATETASKKHNKRDKMTSRKNVKHHKTSSNKNVKHRKPSSGEHGRRQKTPSHQHHRHHETPDLNMPKFEPN